MIDRTLMLKGLMASMSEERHAAATNMRLGAFIDDLAACDPALPLVLDDGRSLDHFHSYRGYYEDLAVEATPAKRLVGDVLADARAACGAVFTGYKGGEY